MSDSTLDGFEYREGLASLFRDLARETYLQSGPSTGAVEDRTARGLLDVADFITALPPDDDRIVTLMAFYPNPGSLHDLLQGSPGDPLVFRSTDPDERIADFLDFFVTEAVARWTLSRAGSDTFTAVPLIRLIEDADAPPASKLAAIGEMSEYLEFMEEWFVSEARDRGWSWARIARPLRKSRQAVQQRWADATKKPKVW